MTTFARTIKHPVAALALLGTVSVAALGSGVAHAGNPQIAVSNVSPTVIQVTGSGFGPGDPVLVEVRTQVGNTLLTTVDTTATSSSFCIKTPLGCVPALSGTISVDTPAIRYGCAGIFVTVTAIDTKTLATSNHASDYLGWENC